MEGTKENIIIAGAVIAFAVISLSYFFNASTGSGQDSSQTADQTNDTLNITQTGAGEDAQNRTPDEPEYTYGLMAWANKVDEYRILEFNGRKAIIVKFNETFVAFYSGCVNPEAEPTVFSGKIACPKAGGGNGSMWVLYTGALLDGPATEPLEEIPLKIEEDRILGRLD